MTELDLAFARVADEATKLNVLQRVALIRDWPGSSAELAPLSTCMPLLLAMPDNEETARIAGALVDGIREMTPQARRVYVATIYSGQLETGYAQPLLDALAALVSAIDRGVS